MVKIFSEYNKVKITVIKRLYHKKIVSKYKSYPDWKRCNLFKEEQEFIVSEVNPWIMHNGFCGWAWADIQKIVWSIARGGAKKYVTSCKMVISRIVFIGKT